MAARSEFYQRAEVRIEWMAVTIGLVAAVLASFLFSWRAGVGVAAGTALAWVNSRWLRQGLDALREAAVVQHRPELPESSRGRVPGLVAAKLVGRYVLLGLVAYVIVSFFSVPVVSVLAGFLSLGAAAMVEGVYEAVARP